MWFTTSSLIHLWAKISAGFSLKKGRKNLGRKSNRKTKISVSVADDRYAVSNGGGYAVLISWDEYAVLDRELDTPHGYAVSSLMDMTYWSSE
ncbi:hypothetical protein Tco_0424430 [Tanacetum coccineum]